MNDSQKQQAKARVKEALKETQVQAEEAAVQLGGLLRIGANKLRQAAGMAREAIQRDIDSRH